MKPLLLSLTLLLTAGCGAALLHGRDYVVDPFRNTIWARSPQVAQNLCSERGLAWMNPRMTGQSVVGCYLPGTGEIIVPGVMIGGRIVPDPDSAIYAAEVAKRSGARYFHAPVTQF